MPLGKFVITAVDTFSPETLIPLLSQNAVLLLLTLPGLVLYGYLADKTAFEGGGRVRSERFAPGDLLIALILVLMFVGFISMQLAAPTSQTQTAANLPGAVDMIGGILYSEVIFLGMAAGPLVALKLRGMSLRETFGLKRLGTGGVLGAAFVLLLVAFPLIAASLEISRVLLAGAGYRNTEPQEMVRFLAKDGSQIARFAVAFSAVVMAPFQEELIFRGYLYGVARRFVGPAGGAVLVSLLFAAIHVHAPSFAGLFVLAMCLTLAYEWTGSLFVPMAMHAMFNSITVINLLAGGSAQG